MKKVCTINLSCEDGRQTIYWCEDDGRMYSDHDGMQEVDGYSYPTYEAACEAAAIMWCLPEWEMEWEEE